MWRISDPPIAFLDFAQAYYPAGRAILADVSALYQHIAACEEMAICGFVNIPVVAFLFSPLSMLTLNSAQLFFAALSLIGVLLTISMLWHISAPLPATRYAITFLFVCNGPLFYSLKEGNLTHFVLLLLVASVVCLDKDRDYLAGALLAIAAVLKLPLLLLGLYFVFNRRWAVVTGFGSALTALIMLSLLYAGWNSHVEWYQEAIRPFANKGLSAFNVQSFDGFLLRLGDDARLYDWKPAEVVWQLRMLRYAFAAALLASLSRLFRCGGGASPKETEFLELSMVLCVALIVSPISWTHYYVLLLLPLCLYAGQRFSVPQRGAWLGWMAVCMLLISPPVTFVKPSGGFISQIMMKLFVSHYWAGALLLLTLLGCARLKIQQIQNVSATGGSADKQTHAIPAYSNLSPSAICERRTSKA
jgi:hypothetical protein